MPPDNTVPGFFHTPGVGIRRRHFKINVAGHIAEHQRAGAAHPVGLLHAHEREGLVHGGGIGHNGGEGVLSGFLFPGSAEAFAHPRGQAVHRGTLKKQASVEPDLELPFEEVEEVEGQQAVDAHFDEAGVRIKGAGFHSQDGRGL